MFFCVVYCGGEGYKDFNLWYVAGIVAGLLSKTGQKVKLNFQTVKKRFPSGGIACRIFNMGNKS